MEVLVGGADLTNLFFRKKRKGREQIKQLGYSWNRNKGAFDETGERTSCSRTAAPEPDVSPLTSYSFLCS